MKQMVRWRFVCSVLASHGWVCSTEAIGVTCPQMNSQGVVTQVTMASSYSYWCKVASGDGTCRLSNESSGGACVATDSPAATVATTCSSCMPWTGCWTFSAENNPFSAVGLCGTDGVCEADDGCLDGSQQPVCHPRACEMGQYTGQPECGQADQARIAAGDRTAVSDGCTSRGRVCH
jgi:hypothetical protein